MVYWILYNVGIRGYFLLIWIASFFNEKARKFVEGRKTIDRSVVVEGGVWIHVSSLGEFEQARPLIERLRAETNEPITLTFFSPSGYEVRKSYNQVDQVLYMPLDTYARALDFVETYKFKLAVFVKYDFWMNHLQVCIDKKIPVVFISVLFRSNQFYFKSGRSFYLPMFRSIRQFFVQNMETRSLLQEHAIEQVTQVGDTRVDRVLEIAQQAQKIAILDQLEDQRKIFVVGSAWESDRRLLEPLFRNFRETFLFIIAPHDISTGSIDRIMQGFENVQRYTSWEKAHDFDFLVIDTIGMLASLYSYADYTYVGGAFKGTLHNTLEPAAHGKPVFFGDHPRNAKFKEAVELQACQGAFSFSEYSSLETKLKALLRDDRLYSATCEASRNYIQEQSGATEQIFQYLQKLLK